ncbi:MAG TPA: ABC transporter permease [Gemmatimonadaceae bacterium]|nr:ABC transporter permease [Gemmatimonadaceae bacterium]
MVHDFRFAIRSLRRRPTFAAAVILTLALGIGTSSAVFSLLDAALIKPLPFANPSRLAILWGVFGPQRDVRGASHREITDWRELSRSFSDVAAYDNISLNLGTSTEPRRVESEMVSASYFDILGVGAQRGRTFLSDEDRVPDAHPVAIISHGLWSTQFGADPGVVGRAITLNNRAFTVVGVMKPGFRGVSFNADVWVPMMMVSLTASPGIFESRNDRWLGAIGRLKPGATMESAQHDLDAVAARLAERYPATNANRGVNVVSLQDDALGPTRQLLVSLFVGVMLFLLIACANVINLQLVRATSRRREMALRIAVGADRSRLFRQLLAEGLTLAAAGAVAGIAIAVWGLDALFPLLPDGALPTYVTPTVDWRVLTFATALTLVCGVVFGLVPALQAQRLTIADALKDGSRSAAGGIASIRRVGAQQIMVVSEIAFALVLLIAGALMLRSLQRQLDVEPGFRPDGVVSARLSLPRGRYAAPERVRFVNELLARLRALPEIESAAIGSDIPLGDVSNGASMFIDGVTPVPTRYFRHRVSPDYFATLGIPLLRGRSFTDADRDSTPLVVVISEAMERRFWPNADAVGHRVRLGDATGAEAMVVGVVGTARFRDLTTNLGAASSEPDIFVSFAQRSDVDLSLVVRASGRVSSRSALVAAVQREVGAIDAGLPLYRIASMSDYIARQTATGRFGSTVLGSFSIVALLLASIGIYGVLAFVIGLSRREIAIRMALGATRGRVVALIVRQGMSLVGAGLALGLVGAFFATEALSSQLFGITATDPATFVAVPLVLAAVALAASYLPSRTAARIDPQQALKSD